MTNYRSPIRIIKTDFRGGETDPLFDMRLDVKSHPSSSRSLTNMLLQNTGGCSRRPGMVTVATLPAQPRLIEFEFDVNEKYMLAFSAGRVDFYDVNGTLLQSITGQPWNATTIYSLTTFQKGDVMIVAHTEFQMRRIQRTGLSTFTIELYQFGTDTGENIINQPHIKFFPFTTTLAISDYTPGSGRTLTSSPGLFTTAWVGERVRIYGKEIIIESFVSATQVLATVTQRIEAQLNNAPFRYTEGSAVIEVTHVLHGLTSGATVNIQGASDTFSVAPSEINGDRVITVLDENTYNVTSTGTGADASGDGGGPSVTIATTSATTSWTEQIWSNRRGWPGAVALHENRVWFGGSKSAPSFLAGSAIGDYYDFNVRDGLADESVQGTISTEGRIQYLVSARNLQIFTDAAEAATETQTGDPITPATLKVVTHTTYGSHPFGHPRIFDGATLFIQTRGKNVREMMFDYRVDGYTATAVSMLSSHMISAPIDMASFNGTGTRPEQYAFFVNNTGRIACFHSIRSDELAAWTEFRNGRGTFESVAVMGHTVFFAVARDGQFHLDRWELDATDIWLDGAVKLSGASSTTWALGARYAGRTVSVMSSGVLLGQFTANGSGVITLPSAVTNIVAGYDYPISIVPLPPDTQLQDGPMTGENRRIVSANIHFRQSVSAAVNGIELLTPPNPQSGKKKVRLLGYNVDPFITITQPAPGPLTVLGMNLEVSI